MPRIMSTELTTQKMIGLNVQVLNTLLVPLLGDFRTFRRPRTAIEKNMYSAMPVHYQKKAPLVRKMIYECEKEVN